jgi:ABC-type multidrug transport system, ATPase component
MNTLIEIKNLTKKYYTKVALENFTMNFESGKIYGLLGPNGSGKTTLMKVIAGLHKANGGETFVNGQPLSYKTKAFVAFMPTENYFPDNYKVKTVINYFADMYKDFNKEKATALVQKLGIDINVKIKSLSTGLLAKLKVALTTSRDALIYMYDEPLNGLDILAREVIIDTIISTSAENKIL